MLGVGAAVAVTFERFVVALDIYAMRFSDGGDVCVLLAFKVVPFRAHGVVP